MIFNEENGGEFGLKHAIKGYSFEQIAGLETRLGEGVRGHLLVLGNEVDNHPMYRHG